MMLGQFILLNVYKGVLMFIRDVLLRSLLLLLLQMFVLSFQVTLGIEHLLKL